MIKLAIDILTSTCMYQLTGHEDHPKNLQLFTSIQSARSTFLLLPEARELCSRVLRLRVDKVNRGGAGKGWLKS